MSEILLGKGFELSIGFLHQSEGHDRYWNMLAYDFIEPYRVWIDNAVKEMIADFEQRLGFYGSNFNTASTHIYCL